MQKFSDYEYTHVDFEESSKKAMYLIGIMNTSKDFSAFKAAVIDFNKLYSDVISSAWLCEIRHTCNTKDEFYAREQSYYDKCMPMFLPVLNEYCKSMISSVFRSDIANEWGEHLVTICEYQLKSMDVSIVGYLQQENALASEYQKLMASSQIEFMGESLTLPSLMKYLEDSDRQTRANAAKAFNGFLKEKQPVLDELFDKLVKVRTLMGKAMGYDSYLPLGYIRMRRYDYEKKDVETLRNKVKEYIVPLCTKLRKKQAQRIGVDKLMFWDNTVLFSDGNPSLCGEADFIISQALEMYSEIGAETKEFFEFMYESELMDLKSRSGKAMGGYCSAIPNKKAPFIFANFNSTAADAEVLTHEAGHALNTFYVMKKFDMLQLAQSTNEVAEIHSTGMEFLTSPYMHRFFGGDAQKYNDSHLFKTFVFLAYGCCVDEFQHVVYENPEMSPSERRTAWRELEKTYMPHLDYADNDALEGGAYWFRQLHIFMHPLYYIDYVLATVSALELYNIMKKDNARAWKMYNKLSSLGATLPYKQLLKSAGLSCPFEDDALQKIIAPVYEELMKK